MPTVEELQSKVSELEARLNRQPKNLDDQIRYFQEKKQKIDNLDMFSYTRTTLTEAQARTKKMSDSADFENEEFRITLTAGASRHNDGTKLFSISNPLIINESLVFIIEAIDRKIKELEKEIAA
jgi:hypothetical protein